MIWKPVRECRPPEGLRVRVQSGAMSAIREIKSFKDYQGAVRYFWWDGQHIDQTAWAEYQEIPGEQISVGPGFC
jgi:hypothetical protein